MKDEQKQKVTEIEKDLLTPYGKDVGQWVARAEDLLEIIDDLQKEVEQLRTENNARALLIDALKSENDELTKERDDAYRELNEL